MFVEKLFVVTKVASRRRVSCLTPFLYSIVLQVLSVSVGDIIVAIRCDAQAHVRLRRFALAGGPCMYM